MNQSAFEAYNSGQINLNTDKNGDMNRVNVKKSQTFELHQDDDQRSMNSNLSNSAKVMRPTSSNYHGKTGSPMKATSAMNTSPTTAASKSFNNRSKPSSIKKGGQRMANYEEQQFSEPRSVSAPKGKRSVTVVSRGNNQQQPNPYRQQMMGGRAIEQISAKSLQREMMQSHAMSDGLAGGQHNQQMFD